MFFSPSFVSFFFHSRFAFCPHFPRFEINNRRKNSNRFYVVPITLLSIWLCLKKSDASRTDTAIRESNVNMNYFHRRGPLNLLKVIKFRFGYRAAWQFKWNSLNLWIDGKEKKIKENTIANYSFDYRVKKAKLCVNRIKPHSFFIRSSLGRSFFLSFWIFNGQNRSHCIWLQHKTHRRRFVVDYHYWHTIYSSFSLKL